MRLASFVILSVVTSAVLAIPVPLDGDSVAMLGVRSSECKRGSQCAILTSLQRMEVMPSLRHVSTQS